jgi:hypothetical protein
MIGWIRKLFDKKPEPAPGGIEKVIADGQERFKESIRQTNPDVFYEKANKDDLGFETKWERPRFRATEEDVARQRRAAERGRQHRLKQVRDDEDRRRKNNSSHEYLNQDNVGYDGLYYTPNSYEMHQTPMENHKSVDTTPASSTSTSSTDSSSSSDTGSSSGSSDGGTAP